MMFTGGFMVAAAWIVTMQFLSDFPEFPLRHAPNVPLTLPSNRYT